MLQRFSIRRISIGILLLWSIIIGWGCSDSVQPRPCYFPQNLGDSGLLDPEIGAHKVVALARDGRYVAYISYIGSKFGRLLLLEYPSSVSRIVPVEQLIQKLGFILRTVVSVQWAPYSDRYIMVEARTVADNGQRKVYGRNYFLIDLDSNRAIRLFPKKYASEWTVADEFQLHHWMQKSTKEKNLFDAGNLGVYWVERDSFLVFPQEYRIPQWRGMVGAVPSQDWWQSIAPKEDKVFLRVPTSTGYAYFVNDYQLPLRSTRGYPIIVQHVSWSPDSKCLALVVMPIPPKIFPEIWIMQDVDVLLMQRPDHVKPDRVLDMWQLFCGYRFIPSGDFITEKSLIVTMVPRRSNNRDFSFGYLYEIEISGRLVSQLTAAPW